VTLDDQAGLRLEDRGRFVQGDQPVEVAGVDAVRERAHERLGGGRVDR
jgi:hypothetical protein